MRRRSVARALSGLLLLLALILASSCSGTRGAVGGETLVSGGPAPAWTQHPHVGDTVDQRAFVGLSTDTATESAARTGALDNARTQIVESMGTYVSRRLHQVFIATGSASGMSTPVVTGIDLRELVSDGEVRTWAEDWHIQRWERETPYGVEYYHKAYVLVLVPLTAAKSTMRQAAQAAVAAVDDPSSRTALDAAVRALDEMNSDEW